LGISQKKFTDEQVELVSNINIIAYAQSRGYDLKRISNNTYKIPGYGGLFISGDGSKWNWFSQNKGGGIIQFVMEMEGKSWVEAVGNLLGISDVEMPARPKVKSIETKGEMQLPKKNDTYKHLFAYLIKSRNIETSVVTEFVDKKLIYEDHHNNCVFVGYDLEGKPAYASRRNSRTTGENFRGDVRNSDKSIPFYYQGEGNTVCVFEAPIDLMSYLSLLKLHGIKNFSHHMISLGGISDKALDGFLKRQRDIEKIVLCLDNDVAGNTACQILNAKYKTNYEIVRHVPKGKDFNEDLKNMKNAMIGMAREPPEDYKEFQDFEEEMEME